VVILLEERSKAPMTQRERGLRRLHEVPEKEVEDAIKQLTLHIKARMRLGSFFDRTKTGAHSEVNLGMDPIDYYVGESIRRLFDPGGWEWQFEKFTLPEQLKRIANKIISDKVAEYKRKREIAPSAIDKDVSNLYDLSDNQDVDEEVFARLRELAYELSKDDDDLAYFALRYFEGGDGGTIAAELGLEAKDVYVLRRKLVRRLTSHKDELYK
jgi:hypothetical protein